jgi:CarboxypepD_reg-like domain/TonB-dependent Receptor Plug Domain
MKKINFIPNLSTNIGFGLLFWLCSQVSFGQNYNAKLEGYVTDFATKKPIEGISVNVRQLRKGVTTDANGYYSISVLQGKYVIAFTGVGHQLAVKELKLYEDTRLDMEMKESAKDLDEVIVSGKKAEDNTRSVTMGTIKLNVSALKKIPVVFGETDILKALTLQPGVTTVGEGAGGFNVRGGRVDQNLVLLDEMPIFNTSHLLGFFANVNPDVVSDVSLYKGGIPANYGGRLSSLLTINTKNGNSEKWRLSWGAGPISARIMTEGPVIKDKLTLLVGARIAYPNWMISQFPDRYAKSRAFFYDGNAKLQYRLNKNNSIALSAYQSYDNFKFPDDTLYDWRSTAASLKWSSVINSKLSLDAVLVDSYYEFGMKGLKDFYGFYLKSSIEHQEAKVNFLYTPSEKHKIEWGANIINHKVSPSTLNPDGVESSINRQSIRDEFARETAGYVSWEFAITKLLSIQLGGRFSSFSQLGNGRVNNYEAGAPKTKESIIDSVSYSDGQVIKTYSGFEPRLSLKIGLDDNNSVKLSYNRMRQYLHLISNTTAISPVDFWKISDTHIQPQVGDQYAIGFFKNLNDDMFETSIEGYYKDILNMIEYKNGATLLLNPILETGLLNAIGKSYGVEISFKKNKGKITGQGSYTYSRSFAKVQTPFPLDLVNRGDWFPSNFDRPHNVVGSVSAQVGKGWTFAGNFTYTTGRPITYPDGLFIFNNQFGNNYSLRNADRLPDYHRMDLSISKDTRHSKDQKKYAVWNFSLYNLYGRNNAYSIYSTRFNRTNRFYQLSVLGSIIPSITFNLYY